MMVRANEKRVMLNPMKQCSKTLIHHCFDKRHVRWHYAIIQGHFWIFIMLLVTILPFSGLWYSMLIHDDQSMVNGMFSAKQVKPCWRQHKIQAKSKWNPHRYHNVPKWHPMTDRPVQASLKSKFKIHLNS